VQGPDLLAFYDKRGIDVKLVAILNPAADSQLAQNETSAAEMGEITDIRAIRHTHYDGCKARINADALLIFASLLARVVRDANPQEKKNEDQKRKPYFPCYRSPILHHRKRGWT
jgi:hypothetical protein